MEKVQVFLVMLVLVIASSNAQPNVVCTKDILVLLDTSFSIGRQNFNRKVKPFLQQLVNDADLNVSPQGTHIAILAFSSGPQTKLRLPFRRGYGTALLNRTINNDLSWDRVRGGQTRTDLAFQKASEIFNEVSPLNHRTSYDDVIVLITDGEPHGVRNAKQVAIAEAKKLKDKGVTIIGVGVGHVNMLTLRDISSPGEALEATFENIHTILERLVAGSCQPIGPAASMVKIGFLACDCPPVNLADQYITDSNSLTRQVSWNIPQPECSSNLLEIALINTVPDAKPRDSFPIGRHNIQYTYSVSGTTLSEVKCEIGFEVKGANLCRGKPYSKVREVCCCGTIHLKQDNYECCGVDYYSKTTKKCCPVSTVRDIDQSCYGPPCKCPVVNLGTIYMRRGGQRTRVTWSIPRPTCGGRLQTTRPNERPGQNFSPGVYTVQYLYRTRNQFDVTCTLRFEVKACGCPLFARTILNATPGTTSMAVTWEEPKPTCPDEVITDVTAPQEKQGHYFSIGQHSILYTYKIDDQFDLRCGVMVEVRGALCRDKGYNPSNQVCCCGTVHNIISGYDCCGQDYHSKITHQCCPNSVVRHKSVPCPRGIDI